MPFFSELSSAAEIWLRKYSPGLTPSGCACEEIRSEVVATSAITSEPNSTRAVAKQSFSVKKKHGHARFILGCIPNLFNGVGFPVERNTRTGPRFHLFVF